MKKYLYLLNYEFKTIIRDPLNLYMCSFPFIILLLSSVIFPLILSTLEGKTLEITMLLLLIVIVSYANFILAAMATFLLLEQKDENTLKTIAVTPVGTKGYLKFKMTYIYIMTLLFNIIVVYGTKVLSGEKYSINNISLFENINFIEILLFSFVSGIFTVSLSLFQAALAKNKVEGFAFIKGTGLLALIPMVMVLDSFQDGFQYVLGIFPNFWFIKGIMHKLFPINSTANLSYTWYIVVGIIYNVIILISAYRLFNKKNQY